MPKSKMFRPMKILNRMTDRIINMDHRECKIHSAELNPAIQIHLEELNSNSNNNSNQLRSHL